MYQNPAKAPSSKELRRLGLRVPDEVWRKEAGLAAKKEFPLDLKNRVGESFIALGNALLYLACLMLTLELFSVLFITSWTIPWKLIGTSFVAAFLSMNIGERLAGQRRARLAARTHDLLQASLKAHEAELAADERFYASEEWRRLRARVIRRDGRVCQNPGCGTYIESDFDLTVDHIKPRSLFPELALDPSNLQVLCRGCNSSKGNQV